MSPTPSERVSEAGHNVAAMQHPHPWQRLQELAHIKLEWHTGGKRGWCRHSTQKISLREDLSQADRRSALLHEIEHLVGGPAIRGYVDQDEQAVRARAARWLIPFENLAEAMVWAGDEYELAEELWVDVFTVRERLNGLTAGESAELERLMLAAELTYPRR